MANATEETTMNNIRKVIGLSAMGLAGFMIAATALASDPYKINFAPAVGSVGSVTFSPSGGTGCVTGTVVGISPSNTYTSEGTVSPSFPTGTLDQTSFTFTASSKNGSGGDLTIGTLGTVSLQLKSSRGTGSFSAANVLEWTPDLIVQVENSTFNCVSSNAISPTFTSTTTLVDGSYNGTLSVGTASSAGPTFSVSGTCTAAIAEQLECAIGVLSGISTAVSYSQL
jgi:hypothetical protein